jgi:hypothetical protein
MDAAPIERSGDRRVTLGTWVWPIGAGVALGAFSAAADRLPQDLPVIVAMGNAAGPWLGAAFLIGALQRRPWRGAVAATLALAIAVIAYYTILGLSGPTSSPVP